MSTTIAVPSTPTTAAAGVATIPPFSGSISPKTHSVEARLELSLGAFTVLLVCVSVMYAIARNE